MIRSQRNLFTTGIAFLAGVALLVSACGGGGDDDDDDDSSEPGGSDATATQESGGNNGGNQSGGDPTATSESGGGNGGGDSDDVEQLQEDLVPPKSKELLRYSTPDGTSISYESTESLDSLKEFYDDRVDDLDLGQLGNMSMPDSHSWFIGNNSGQGVQGSVTVVNAGDGKTNITVTLSKGTS